MVTQRNKAAPPRRKPLTPDYDAHLGLAADFMGQQIAFAVVKFTYELMPGGHLSLTNAEPLNNNIFDEAEKPRLKPGCDFWPCKLATDVVVQGKAYGEKGRLTSRATVSVRVGKYEKKAMIFGCRRISYPDSRGPRFSEPEPFESIELTYYNAYGGIDWRVPLEEEMTLMLRVRLERDHPGLYPRNPFGCGYVVMPDRKDIDGAELPNVENPADLLTPERLITGNPRLWHRQPLPWGFDWVQAFMFPRSAFFGGADGWYPAPEDSVAEVQMGILPQNYRSMFQESLLTEGPDPRFCNEASTGMQMPFLACNENILLKGFDPNCDLRFSLPSQPPQIYFVIENKAKPCRPILHSLLIKPEQRRVVLVWGAQVRTPRLFIEGIHRDIDIKAYVNGDELTFVAPIPILQVLKDKGVR